MSPEAVAPPQPEKAVPQRIFRLPREIGILGALGLMLLVLAVFIPQFRDLQNIINITRNFSFVGIVAMGMTLVILTGGIDLSVGSVWGMTAVIVAFLLTHGWPVLLAILVSLLAAAGIGLMNGLVHHPLENVTLRADARDSLDREKLRADCHSRAADFNFWRRISIFSLAGWRRYFRGSKSVYYFLHFSAVFSGFYCHARCGVATCTRLEEMRKRLG